MQRIAAADRIGHHMIAHLRGHGWEAFGQGLVQCKWIALCLLDQFSEKPVKEGFAFDGIGRTSPIFRTDLLAVQLQRSRGGQAIARPELGEDEVVSRRHPPLPARKIKRVFDSLEKGLAARLAVFSGDTGGIETCAEQIQEVFVIRRRGFDST